METYAGTRKKEMNEDVVMIGAGILGGATVVSITSAATSATAGGLLASTASAVCSTITSLAQAAPAVTHFAFDATIAASQILPVVVAAAPYILAAVAVGLLAYWFYINW